MHARNAEISRTVLSVTTNSDMKNVTGLALRCPSCPLCGCTPWAELPTVIKTFGIPDPVNTLGTAMMSVPLWFHGCDNYPVTHPP